MVALASLISTEELNVKTTFIIAIATLVGLLSACGQGDNAAKSAATAPVALPATEPATPVTAPVAADPVAGTPTPAAEGAPAGSDESRY